MPAHSRESFIQGIAQGPVFIRPQRLVRFRPMGRSVHVRRERQGPRGARGATGFTLIELLVVVAIIALLISILLPALAGAREQGRKTKCIANLKNIGTTMHMYFNENRDWFPFEKHPFPSPGWPLSAFHYGGHPGRPGDKDPKSPDYSATFNVEKLRDTFRGRPFNNYMFLDMLDSLEKIDDADTPEFEERRRPLELAYGCPSDLGSQVASEKSTDPGGILPTVYLHGTSYDINYHWVWFWAARSDWASPPWPAYMKVSPFAKKVVYLQRANRFLRIQREHHVADFVMLYEDRFDSPLLNKLPRIGWHKQLNKHSFLFLDGHAANITANTLKGRDGPGWKTASGPWYTDPNDPDYSLRDLDP
jgi:prepilin-type N-terminal cleavage/methylation domain-containing protein